MLSSINLENFKSFKSLSNLKIKPITILCGTNSCGKSSILQSLLILKQTKESRSSNQSLLLNGKYAHLGDIENIVHGCDKNKVITLDYEYEFMSEKVLRNKNGRRGPSYVQILRYLLDKKTIAIKNATYTLKYEIKFKIDEKNKGYIKTADILEFNISVFATRENGGKKPCALIRITKTGNTYSMEWERVPSPFSDGDKNSFTKKGSAENIHIRFENLSPRISFTNANYTDGRPEHQKVPFEIIHYFRMVEDFIVLANEGISYVGPLREEPSRRYIYENEVLEIGSKGENAAYVYQTEQENIIKKHYFYDEKIDKFEEKENLSLKEGLELWLNLMNIKGFSPDFQSEIIRLAMNANSSKETRVNIADVGFGVSQIFPILLEGLRMQQDDTLLLEQPEIHLHPALQMQMADYFISLALSDKNLIVETHSDHIINRLVRRIVEDETGNLSKMIAIYFVTNSDDGAQVEEIKITEDQGIVNWPIGFFDQTASEQEKIMLAGIKKRKKRRGGN